MEPRRRQSTTTRCPPPPIQASILPQKVTPHPLLLDCSDLHQTIQGWCKADRFMLGGCDVFNTRIHTVVEWLST
uniref:Uncharacterized protein n=1 Tax=Physcomitrium patens TaxID=3218 RepID=A0A2K1J7Y7_PHYPA|nr:hypothetical protein PHYPA_020736 [Physcomitrium patens]